MLSDQIITTAVQLSLCVHLALLPPTSESRLPPDDLLARQIYYMMQHFFAQLLLAALAVAAPIAEETVIATAGGNAWQYGTGGGIIGLIVLILDIIVFGVFPFPCLINPLSVHLLPSPLTSALSCSRGHQVQPSPIP